MINFSIYIHQSAQLVICDVGGGGDVCGGVDCYLLLATHIYIYNIMLHTENTT